MRLITLLLVVLVCGCMTSHPLQPRVVMSVFWDLSVTPDAYDSIEEAAVAAETLAYSRTSLYETGGVITQEGSKFRVSVPRTDWSAAHVGTDHEPNHYRGKIVGDYHTHICLTKSFVPADFSAPDLNSYEVNHEQGFMLDTCTGDVHAFIPGVDHRYRDSEDTVGRIIGHVAVTGAELE